MAEAPRKETISSRISATLRHAILRGDLAPGSRINLDRLREEHDISISPLREAVSRLVADGLVEFEDQRGYRVAPVSSANLTEVTALRAELDVMALRASIAHGGLDWESDVMRTHYLLTRSVRDPARPETVAAWEEAHAEFHLALIRGCGMPLVLSFCKSLHNMIDRYRHLYPLDDVTDRDIEAEHSEIAAAATAHDSDRACVALRSHILCTGQALSARMAVQG
ncbi:GntR family transcriptional regulator [Fuscovulum ytuae]|uniref:FCD domain-containing protein n=1 Tax=Fuscovulum ytuae TaxID=3042299 RepID=A0ABY8Q2Z8_9RHOB|nr:FCD domain-containing protein [Fuscovulum sp. YMD61]WGV15018.1 FCD domain-containing protein [Fuscovulum sp. YMD61]